MSACNTLALSVVCVVNSEVALCVGVVFCVVCMCV